MELEEIYNLEDRAPYKLSSYRNDREIGLVSGIYGYERITRVKEVNMRGKKIRY